MKLDWKGSKSSTRTKALRSAVAWRTASARRTATKASITPDPENRDFAKKAVEMAARHFDEILLDDYFFFDRKTDYDIQAKGNRSWTQYRLDTMREVTENLIVKPAKAVNPKCKVVIKMANWYDQFAGMGNDTEKVPLIADGMFSGTESRLWVGQEQHLQPYLSYDIMRFMDNLMPGVNQGGWVDQGGANPIDRYAEQLLDTVFARCPEMCCFNYSAMIRPISRNSSHQPNVGGPTDKPQFRPACENAKSWER